MAGGTSATPLTFQEIESWSRLTATPLDPWEAEFIVRLSREYAIEQSLASDEDRPPPYEKTRPARAKREAVDRAMRSALSSAANAPPPDPRRKRKRKP